MGEGDGGGGGLVWWGNMFGNSFGFASLTLRRAAIFPFNFTARYYIPFATLPPLFIAQHNLDELPSQQLTPLTASRRYCWVLPRHYHVSDWISRQPPFPKIYRYIIEHICCPIKYSHCGWIWRWKGLNRKISHCRWRRNCPGKNFMKFFLGQFTLERRNNCNGKKSKNC